MAKFEIVLNEKKGSCETELFEKMVKSGDIQATPVKSMINENVSITGYALAHITTDDKDFDMGYYATDKGILSTGSKVFKDSVEKYFGEAKEFRIIELRTKKGTTFKVTPILEVAE